MKREIYTLNQYGHVEINIKEIMDKKNVSRNALARAINTRFEVIDKWYNGHVETMKKSL